MQGAPWRIWQNMREISRITDETGPLRGFVETVYELCGRQGSMEFGVRPPNAEGIVNLIPDIRKMERVVGWKPQVYFEEGMKRILAFQK